MSVTCLRPRGACRMPESRRPASTCAHTARLVARMLWCGAASALATAGLMVLAAGGAAALEVPHALVQVQGAPRPEDGPRAVLAATLNPYTVVRKSWADRLIKLQRGGFNAVYAAVPWSVGQAGGVSADDLGAFLTEAKARGLKAVVGPPPGAPPGDWRQWLTALKPVLQQHAANILWVHASAENTAAAAEAAQAVQCPVPVAGGTETVVRSSRDTERPYREPAVSIALRAAAQAGSSALIWDGPFAGIAPPILSDAADAPPPSAMDPDQGGLPLSYYEAHLFSQVVEALGNPLFEAEPVDGAASDGAGVTVAQRTAGRQSFLFVQTPAEPLRSFHLTYVDPETKERVTVPKTEGVALRSFGSGARILPVNLPVPGATICYSTAEVYGIYRLGQRTAILLADDEGAPNEIALKLETDQKPPVVGGLPTDPVWDEKTRTLTLAFAAAFGDTFVAIGDNLVLGIVCTERAQRTWRVHYNDLTIPLITSAYLVGVEEVIQDKLAFSVLTQQGKTAVAALVEKRPGFIAAQGLGLKVTYDARTCAYEFRLQTPMLAGANLKVPVVQAVDKARFDPKPDAAADFVGPAFNDTTWQEVRLNKPHGTGCYRVRFRLPAISGWIIPWKATLNLSGKANVHLNGAPLGTFAGSPDGSFVDVSLPPALLNAGTAGNVLAITLTEGTGIGKVGISPYMEHAVENQAVVIYM